MEARGLSVEVLNERFNTLHARTKSHHDSISKLREEKELQGKALVRMEEQLENQGEDIAEMKKTMTWIVRGLFGAIAVGLMFVVAVVTLIVQVAGG
jgi:predicted  nucleic acid-binding Zn-ribbon protein